MTETRRSLSGEAEGPMMAYESPSSIEKLRLQKRASSGLSDMTPKGKLVAFLATNTAGGLGGDVEMEELNRRG